MINDLKIERIPPEASSVKYSKKVVGFVCKHAVTDLQRLAVELRAVAVQRILVALIVHEGDECNTLEATGVWETQHLQVFDRATETPVLTDAVLLIAEGHPTHINPAHVNFKSLLDVSLEL